MQTFLVFMIDFDCLIIFIDATGRPDVSLNQIYCIILARACAFDVAYMHDCASTIEEQMKMTGMQNEF